MSAVPAHSVTAKGKSPEAFRTISEVSMELDVPQHVLRFWETRFAQVRPVKRAGGRRFYRPEDVALLKGIRSLLYSDGYTIKGVQKVLRDKGWRHVAELGRGLQADSLSPWQALDDDQVDAPEDTLAKLPVADLKSADLAEAGEKETGARAAISALMRAHADAADTVSLDEHKRVRLELLLAELLVMRDRIRAVRPKA
ncbi:MAG TPA: MerR family transcriptional regulator [Rhizomicrobium sp.]|nr:MerR family transcriptional regulator [Rhizomicrobium sp.]